MKFWYLNSKNFGRLSEIWRNIPHARTENKTNYTSFYVSIHVTVSKKAIIEMEIVASLLCYCLELGLHGYCGAEKVTMTLFIVVVVVVVGVFSRTMRDPRVARALDAFVPSFRCRLIISNDAYRVCEKLRLKPRVSLIRSRGYADNVMV